MNLKYNEKKNSVKHKTLKKILFIFFMKYFSDENKQN